MQASKQATGMAKKARPAFCSFVIEGCVSRLYALFLKPYTILYGQLCMLRDMRSAAAGQRLRDGANTRREGERGG